MNTNTDCDGDGLSNDVEIYKLGTNPYDVDTDHDFISNKLEVQGFTYGGKQWYLNPLDPGQWRRRDRFVGMFRFEQCHSEYGSH